MPNKDYDGRYKNVLDQIRNEICWMIEREDTTTFAAAEKANLPKARLDRFLRSESDDFTVDEFAALFAAHDWYISLGSASATTLNQPVEWFDDGADHTVSRPVLEVEDPAPGLASDALPD